MREQEHREQNVFLGEWGPQRVGPIQLNRRGGRKGSRPMREEHQIGGKFKLNSKNAYLPQGRVSSVWHRVCVNACTLGCRKHVHTCFSSFPAWNLELRMTNKYNWKSFLNITLICSGKREKSIGDPKKFRYSLLVRTETRKVASFFLNKQARKTIFRLLNDFCYLRNEMKRRRKHGQWCCHIIDHFTSTTCSRRPYYRTGTSC